MSFLQPLLNKLKHEKKAFFTFLFVGCITASIYFVVFALCWQVLHFHYKVAVSITYLIAVLFHFTANRYFTFKAHEVNVMQQIVKYLFMVTLNYLTTLVVMHCVMEIFHLSPYVGLLISIILNTNANFLMSRYWVFRIEKISIVS